MTKIQRKRLFRLARHLEKGKRFHRRFDFSKISIIQKKSESSVCGTAGCALGECPAAFPKDWQLIVQQSLFEPYKLLSYVRIKQGSREDAFLDAEVFFGLSNDETHHLFHPNHQLPDQFGGCHLGHKATAKRVARNIRAFLKLKLERT